MTRTRRGTNDTHLILNSCYSFVCADLAILMQTGLLKPEKPIKQSAEPSKVRVQTVATGQKMVPRRKKKYAQSRLSTTRFPHWLSSL